MNFKKYSSQSDLLPAGLPQHSIVTAQAGVTTLGKNLASDWRMRGEEWRLVTNTSYADPLTSLYLGLLLKFIRAQ